MLTDTVCWHNRYFKGEGGVAADPRRAVELWTKASSQGNAEAMCNMGGCTMAAPGCHAAALSCFEANGARRALPAAGLAWRGVAWRRSVAWERRGPLLQRSLP